MNTLFFSNLTLCVWLQLTRMSLKWFCQLTTHQRSPLPKLHDPLWTCFYTWCPSLFSTLAFSPKGGRYIRNLTFLDLGVCTQGGGSLRTILFLTLVHKARERFAWNLTASWPWCTKARERFTWNLTASRPLCIKARERFTRNLSVSRPWRKKARERVSQNLIVSRPWRIKARERFTWNLTASRPWRFHPRERFTKNNTFPNLSVFTQGRGWLGTLLFLDLGV